jgi:hypothetical protein
MPETNVGKRMSHLAKTARWGAYDFAYWLNKPRATVRNWYFGIYEPRGYQKEDVHAALDLLDLAITKGWLEQILGGVSAHERPGKIKYLRTCAESGYIPKSHPAAKRVSRGARGQRRAEMA